MQIQIEIKNGNKVDGNDKTTGRKRTEEEVHRVKRKQEVKEEVEEVEGREAEMHRSDLQEDVKGEQLLSEPQKGGRRVAKAQEIGRRAGRVQESRRRKGKAMCEGLLSLLLILCRLGLGLGKHIEGTLRTTEDWVFLARFCFQSNGSTISFDVEQDMDFAGQRIILYYDSPDQWPAVYKTGKTCLEKEAVVRTDFNQVINLTWYSPECTTPPEEEGEEPSLHCEGNRTLSTKRERWWFVAVSNCGSDQGLQMKYSFTMTNGENYWYRHFSADEFCMLQINLMALGLHLVLLLLSFLAAAKLKKRLHFHTTYLLFMCAVVLHTCSLILCTLHYVHYGNNGVGFPNSLLAGRVLSGCSFMIMVLLLLLTGRGFNITQSRLQKTSALHLTIFMSVFALMYASLFILEWNLFDPGLYLYLYESPFGYCRMAMHLVGLVVLLGTCLSTLGYSPMMSTFFFPFFIFYALWFVAGPTNILLINLILDKVDRERVATGAELFTTFLGHAFFLFLTRPSAANKNFPYLLKKTQTLQMSEVVENNTEMHVLATANCIPREPQDHNRSDALPATEPPESGKDSKGESSTPEPPPHPCPESQSVSTDKDEPEVTSTPDPVINQSQEEENKGAQATAPPAAGNDSETKS